MRQFKVGVDVGENDEPRRLVDCAIVADELAFDSCWFGDHFMPWIHTGGKSAYVWSLITASLERTHNITVGPDVTCPIGGRYHPAIIAQAAATLDNLYPGRFALGIGSGEAVNEARFFYERRMDWPNWAERIERLAEAATLIRELWTRKDYFTFDGKFFKMRDVRLYTRPVTAIPIYFSAMGPKAACYAGRFGDRLIAIGSPDRCRDAIFPKFEEGLRLAGKSSQETEKMVLVNIVMGDPDQNLASIKGTVAGVFAKGALNVDQADPRYIESLSPTVKDDVVHEYFKFCQDMKDVMKVVEDYRAAGADHLVFSTGPSLDLIRQIGTQILPRLEPQ